MRGVCVRRVYAWGLCVYDVCGAYRGLCGGGVGRLWGAACDSLS